MQIPYVLNWKRFFGDYERWHIWGIISTQKIFIDKKETNKEINRVKYLQNIFKGNSYGINAMSISELSGIPRATVVRKINYLLKKKLITIDKKKLYSSATGKSDMKKIIEISDSSMSLLANFFCKTINLIQAN